ncbi:MAG: TonB-dependent receptor, partial [Gammaproteobacteria bacterium]
MPRRSIPWALVAAFAVPAVAQRADENAVTTAQDAFGATTGNESIGLYSETEVRGFSPVTAGNVRIEGLYFDRQGNLPPRLV